MVELMRGSATSEGRWIESAFMKEMMSFAHGAQKSTVFSLTAYGGDQKGMSHRRGHGRGLL
jgi:hypothetical protein